jgi:hypothetical protein
VRRLEGIKHLKERFALSLAEAKDLHTLLVEGWAHEWEIEDRAQDRVYAQAQRAYDAEKQAEYWKEEAQAAQRDALRLRGEIDGIWRAFRSISGAD